MKKTGIKSKYTGLEGEALIRIIQENTGYVFQNVNWLEKALTHPSIRRKTDPPHYERLEFLGDRVLGLVVVDMLFRAFPEEPEGNLCLRFNASVNATTLAEIAAEINLPAFVRASHEMGSLSGQKRENLRADALESFIAAVYLDGGLEAVYAFIVRFWEARVKKKDGCQRDAKTELQEWAHRLAYKAPVYEIHERTGPDHDPVFTVRLHIEGLEPVLGKGNTRRKAEQAAAKALLNSESVSLKEGL